MCTGTGNVNLSTRIHYTSSGIYVKDIWWRYMHKDGIKERGLLTNCLNTQQIISEGQFEGMALQG